MIRRPTRATLLWTLLALAGLVVAVGVSYAASQLSKPRIGLASEPASAGAGLTPKPERPPGHRRGRHIGTTTSTTPTVTVTTPAGTTPVGTPTVSPTPTITVTPRPSPPPARHDDSGSGGGRSGGGGRPGGSDD